jgi:hypothetical protein
MNAPFTISVNEVYRLQKAINTTLEHAGAHYGDGITALACVLSKAALKLGWPEDEVAAFVRHTFRGLAKAPTCD